MSAVLVTGAGGFVGGHVARHLASRGHAVRALTRRLPPEQQPGDPPLDWLLGDLRNRSTILQSVQDIDAVIHCAGWVRLGRDRRGLARAINLDATAALLDASEAAGVRRFIYTSTLWTLAAGTPDQPANEDTPWNLSLIHSPYSETKRQAESLVLSRDRPEFRTLALCPGLVIGPRDIHPTSTGLFLSMARSFWPLFLPGGGIPVIDARAVALAHERALTTEATGQRLALCGPYLSYAEMARLVARLTGNPRHVFPVPEVFRVPLAFLASVIDRLNLDPSNNVSAASVNGGFLRLHVSGARADALFDLHHRPPLDSLFSALDDHLQSGRAPWLDLHQASQ